MYAAGNIAAIAVLQAFYVPGYKQILFNYTMLTTSAIDLE